MATRSSFDKNKWGRLYLDEYDSAAQRRRSSDTERIAAAAAGQSSSASGSRIVQTLRGSPHATTANAIQPPRHQQAAPSTESPVGLSKVDELVCPSIAKTVI